jgi:flavodoxin
MNKILVAYHSRGGYTRRVAQHLARRLGADVEPIRVAQPVAGSIGYALCAIEAIAGIAPALRSSRHDPARYDTVIVGTPVWFWSVSSPVRSWLSLHPLRRARVAFFCTMRGAGAERAFSTMSSLAGSEPVATMALTDDEIDSGDEAKKLDAFVASLKARPRRGTRRAHRPLAAARA